MRYLNLCVEVPEDLEEFDHFELIHDNGHPFFLFYKDKGNKVMRSFFPERIFCASGDLNFVIKRTIKFHNFKNYDEFVDSLCERNGDIEYFMLSMQKSYLKDILSERLKNGLQKKNEKELVPEELSARSRCKKS